MAPAIPPQDDLAAGSRRPARPGRAQRAWRPVGLLLVATGTLLLVLRWVHLPLDTRWVALQSVSPAGAAPVLVGLVVLALARSRAGVVLALVPTLLAGSLGWAALRPRTVPAGEGDLTVMTANVLLGQADVGSLLGHVAEIDPDVLVLVEITPEGYARLRAGGLPRTHPYAIGRPEPHASGLVVLSRHPITAPRTDVPAYGTVRAPGGDVQVRGVHPMAPVHPQTWHDDLDALGDWVAQTPTDAPLVVLGDLNATWSHPQLREAAAGTTDAMRAAGKGLTPTWPVGRRVPAFAQIDHVLVRGLGVVDAGAVTVEGTDHRAVWARLSRR